MDTGLGKSGDEDSFQLIASDAAASIILLCEHASNRIPDRYQQLGMPDSEMQRHIAYDIGAKAVTTGLAKQLAAPAVLSCFSRLLIDPNRGLDDPTLIMRLSDGAIVPGNARIDDAERQLRIERYYKPYHGAIASVIDNSLAAGQIPLVVSIHSFTSHWKGVARPWHIGVLFNDDPRLARPLIDALSGDDDIVTGINEPYAGGVRGETIDHHGWQRRLPSVLIEIRQDLIDNEAGVKEWVDRLAPIFKTINANKDIHKLRD